MTAGKSGKQRHTIWQKADHPLRPTNAHRECALDAVRFFHFDALASSVRLKIDFDMVLLIVASGLYRILSERMRDHFLGPIRSGAKLCAPAGE